MTTKKVSLSMIGHWIAAAWVAVFNAAILFALLNIVFYYTYTDKAHKTFEDRRKAADQSSAWQELYPYDFLKTLYPGRHKRAVFDIANGFTGRGVVYEPYVQFKSEAGLLVGPRAKGENDAHKAARDPVPSKRAEELALAGSTNDNQRDAFKRLHSWGIHEAGFRLIGPGQGPWPPSRDAYVVFVFGGSATAGSGVSDNETIAAYLQAIARERQPGKRIDVYNFGTASHFLNQEGAYFFKMVAEGIRPNAIIFIDGVLEFYNPDGTPSLTKYIDSLFFDEKIVDQEHDLWWYFEKFFLRLPLSIWVQDLKSKQTNPALVDGANAPKVEPLTKEQLQRLQNQAVLDRVIDRYLSNVTLIEGAANGLNIPAYFIWQPTSLYDFYGPTVEAKYDPTMERAKFGYKRMDEYRSKNEMPKSFIWCADIQKGIDRYMYLDGAHYTPWGSMKVAECILDGIEKSTGGSIAQKKHK